MGISQLGSTTSTSRLAMKASTAGSDILGGATSTLTPGSSGSYGSWVQITASTTDQFYIVGVTSVALSGGGNTHYLQVGIGAGGAESVLATAVIQSAGATGGTSSQPGGLHLFPIPLRVPAGTRVAVRASVSGTGGSNTVISAVLAVPYANVEGN